MRKVKVNESQCIGCGACAGIAPEVFEIVDGVSKVKEGIDYETFMGKIDEAIASCPAKNDEGKGAISWVEEAAEEVAPIEEAVTTEEEPAVEEEVLGDNQELAVEEPVIEGAPIEEGFIEEEAA